MNTDTYVDLKEARRKIAQRRTNDWRKSNPDKVKEYNKKYLINKRIKLEELKLKVKELDDIKSKTENDFLFKCGNYSTMFLSEVNDLEYIEHAIKNFNLNDKNLELFKKRVEELKNTEL